MKAIRVHAFGGNEVLSLDELPIPEPGEGELLVRIHAAGVNPVDWKIVRGYLSQGGLPHVLPFVPGWDFAAEVVGRGFAARRFEVGARVFGYLRRPTVQHGTCSEYQLVPEAYAAAMPRTLSFTEAAGVPLAGLTALQSLRAARVGPGQRVLVLGASGGTGAFAVQLARNLGATVTAVASAKNHAFCRALGASDAYDYAGAATGSLGLPAVTCDAIFDAIGGATLDAARSALKPGGHVVSITTRAPPSAYAGLGDRYHYVFVEPNSSQLAELAAWADAGQLVAHVAATFPLERTAEAFAASETGHTRGKIVITLT